jgi:NAD(P)-dependent dehydrogenase (short-subunit alcohol dehydrogenase family)
MPDAAALMAAAAARPVALVTGGARRLGRRIVLALARNGFDVAIHHGHSPADAERLAGEVRVLGARAEIVTADLREAAAAREVVVRAVDRFGRLDAFIGNAGVYPEATTFDRVTEELWDDTFAVNLKSQFFAAQAAAESMIASQCSGRIVFLASLGGMQIWRDRLPYNVSKAALIAMTRALARALAPRGIAVNAVAPGHIEQEEPGAESGIKASAIPMGRYGTADDITRAVIFLARDATYVTGQTIVVDGGRHLSTS